MLVGLTYDKSSKTKLCMKGQNLPESPLRAHSELLITLINESMAQNKIINSFIEDKIGILSTIRP